jgi:DNA-binding MarR family transcriptional regulator
MARRPTRSDLLPFHFPSARNITLLGIPCHDLPRIAFCNRREQGPREALAVATAGYGERVARPLQLPFDPIARAADIWQRRFGPSAEMAAVTSIMRAQQILLAELDAILKPYELTFARYEALVLLSFSRTGALPLGMIGERLMVHPTSVTNIIARLERQGMVSRRPNPSDGRGKIAEITSQGRSVAERATADLAAARFGMAGYGEDELHEMFTLLRQLRVTAGDF